MLAGAPSPVPPENAGSSTGFASLPFSLGAEPGSREAVGGVVAATPGAPGADSADRDSAAGLAPDAGTGSLGFGSSSAILASLNRATGARTARRILHRASESATRSAARQISEAGSARIARGPHSQRKACARI